MQIKVEPKVNTSYHRRMVEDGLLDRLQQFIAEDLVPQLPGPVDVVAGTITPCFNEDHYCGANSAVKDTYRLDVRFFAASEVVGTIVEEIEDDVRNRRFRPRYRHKKLIVLTQARLAAQAVLSRSVQSLCRRIAQQHLAEAICPNCHADLKIIDSPEIFDVRCPWHCFTYNFHRDPASGAFLHGHVIFGQLE